MDSTPTPTSRSAILVDMDVDALRLLAPSGVFSTRAAEAAGHDRRELARTAHAGEITRLSQGWYSPDVDLPPDARHRLLALALAVEYDGRAAPSHYSAAVLHGLPVYGVDRRTVHLTRHERGKTRKRRGLMLWCPSEGRSELDKQRVGLRGISVVPPAEAVMQTALVAGVEAALVCADAALRAGMVQREDLAAAAAIMLGRRGGHALRGVLDHADGRHESVGESRTAFALHRMGLRFTPQVWIEDGDARFRTDFLLDDAPVVIEFDGAVKYEGRRDLLAEKRREDRIRARGFVVVRVTWEDLADPLRLQSRIVEAISAARYGRSA